ncbi:SDR family oxidoreductase [Dictyobacter arantiisoli]|uniref:Gluconate 5-dehydrogenase n=1 Tax=Dictyobacter arantiisoli TaxID=2014874 RepID=A0A5A5TH19_9CHLR|nr:SDR family oxidoreductase [Dictyobacter arantiisoli]GCF10860.1 gluconate 5-dehydrogenase [Dictyobacter arantiisoli]
MGTLDLFRLDGKTAIVTGGGRGLGQYFAQALTEMGARVVLCSRKLSSCDAVRAEIEANGGEALALACDVTNPEDVERVVRTTQERFGVIDVLINNSGTTWGAPPEDMPLEKFEQVLDVNVKGTFLMSQQVGRVMIAQGQGGKIINIASVAGLTGGNPRYLQVVGYHASKAAVINMTRDLATSWARHNITVNAIAPGWFPTRMSQAILARYEQEMLADIPLARFGTPDDIKGVLVFLASPAAAYITGQTVVVDGGAMAW